MLHEFKIQPFSKEINTPNSRIVYKLLNFTQVEYYSQENNIPIMQMKKKQFFFKIMFSNKDKIK